ncbi:MULTISPECIES: putative quinol monooxygenase [unclassified Imperialibacter]|uniref:putative quinol monooxygenase n=1 Tax=unclassified Imperialibacter TaxID=2629706 RepID=UPI00125590FD|nr:MULTISPECIES: putative quinol monooxygenase [unclassified Imperialibacter]CAD5264116.1 Quinol monooxygenase YgiN [Imperialibacter sp. 89]CAD5280199.1 Quinol monooxygenase YgiN [Imperialibacter sp. 75]VVT31733.1 Antibiotic biosynthesis monooxygenase [Imperialibacter sp. EC-SDR9]
MNQPPIYLIVTWKVKQGQVGTVIKHLQEMVPKTRAEAGNLFYTLHQGKDDDHTIALYEGYKDEAALQAHRDADYFKEIVLGKIVPLLESREVLLAHPL